MTLFQYENIIIPIDVYLYVYMYYNIMHYLLVINHAYPVKNNYNLNSKVLF